MSEQTPRVFTTEFKERAVLRLEAGASASAVATELGVRRKIGQNSGSVWVDGAGQLRLDQSPPPCVMHGP